MVTRPLAKKKIVYFFSFCMDVSASIRLSIRLCCDFFVIKSFISLNLRELILNYLNVNSLVKNVQSYPLFKVDSLNIMDIKYSGFIKCSGFITTILDKGLETNSQN